MKKKHLPFFAGAGLMLIVAALFGNVFVHALDTLLDPAADEHWRPGGEGRSQLWFGIVAYGAMIAGSVAFAGAIFRWRRDA